MIETGKIISGDCVEVMKTLPLDSVDLVVTSPPYNVGIDYDSYDDKMSMEDYWNFTRQWLTEAYKTLKDDTIVYYKTDQYYMPEDYSRIEFCNKALLDKGYLELTTEEADFMLSRINLDETLGKKMNEGLEPESLQRLAGFQVQKIITPV